MIFFTSDLHFGHFGIINYCSRPFNSVEEMDAALITNWNTTVGKCDDVYILGDFTMRPAQDAHKYIAQLNGRKYLIKGNHDKFLKGRYPYKQDFEWVKDYHVLHEQGKRIILFHYPILEWDCYYRGSIHLYGHVHNSATSKKLTQFLKGLAFNVGVDCNEFYPVSINSIIDKAGQSRQNDTVRIISTETEISM